MWISSSSTEEEMRAQRFAGKKEKPHSAGASKEGERVEQREDYFSI